MDRKRNTSVLILRAFDSHSIGSHQGAYNLLLQPNDAQRTDKKQKCLATGGI